MPKFLEDKLKAEYGANSSVPYKVMNSIGAMRGSKETAKGAAMEAKHNMKMEHERSTNGGHVFTHRFSGGDEYREPETHTFSADEGDEALAHFAKHSGIKKAGKLSPMAAEGIRAKVSRREM